MDHFTLDDLAEFTSENEQWMSLLNGQSPSENSVSNIMGYCKAYSSRTSKSSARRFEMVLN
jgi:hypothetical protein